MLIRLLFRLGRLRFGYIQSARYVLALIESRVEFGGLHTVVLALLRSPHRDDADRLVAIGDYRQPLLARDFAP